MEKDSSFPGGYETNLLEQFEVILEEDKLIDEIGFLHPSQFASLDEDSSSSSPTLATSVRLADSNIETSITESNTVQYDKTTFWNRDHKLAISTHVLCHLCVAARHAYMDVSRRYKASINLSLNSSAFCSVTSGANLDHLLENEILKHTKALLILSFNFASAWNCRRLVLSRKLEISLFFEELRFSTLILAYAPKCDYAWSQSFQFSLNKKCFSGGYRRWVIKILGEKCQNLQDIIREESDLVEKIAEKSKMNYRAWTHRCWLISYMKRVQVLGELDKSKKWAELHVADNCCFNYRRQLMLNLLEGNHLKHGEASTDCKFDVCFIWKEELQWNELLLTRYIGREALWIHRRFLSQCWIKHFTTNEGAVILDPDDNLISSKIKKFLAKELQLVKSCLNISPDEFDDTQDQARYGASYLLWILKFFLPQQSKHEEIIKGVKDLKPLLLKTCSGKNTCWESLLN
ncbi:unnamed protein product [Musa acuminata subsp. burmannicoides]